MNATSGVATATGKARILRLWMYAFTIITVVHLILVIVPTWWSGLASLTPTAIMAGSFRLPLYPEPLTLWALLVGLVIVLAAWASVPLSWGWMYQLWQARMVLPRRTMVTCLIVNSLCMVVVSATAPMAYTFLIWLID